jgi:hypothetical protein
MFSFPCSFTYCQSLPNASHYQIVIGTTVCCPERSDIKYTWMVSPIYQNMAHLSACLSIRRRPNKFMNIRCGKIVSLEIRFLNVAKFTKLTPLSLLILYKFCFQLFVWKPLFCRLGIEMFQQIFVWYLRNFSNTLSSSSQKLSFISLVLSSVGHEISEQRCHTSDFLVLCRTSYH